MVDWIYDHSLSVEKYYKIAYSVLEFCTSVMARAIVSNISDIRLKKYLPGDLLIKLKYSWNRNKSTKTKVAKYLPLHSHRKRQHSSNYFKNAYVTCLDKYCLKYSIAILHRNKYSIPAKPESASPLLDLLYLAEMLIVKNSHDSVVTPCTCFVLRSVRSVCSAKNCHLANRAQSFVLSLPSDFFHKLLHNNWNQV